MRESIDVLEDTIKASVQELVMTATFSDWLESVRASDGDVIVINNSFVGRDKRSIRTTKNDQYLCLTVRNGAADPTSVCVSRPGDQDSDFKLIKAKSGNMPGLEPLHSALQTEIDRIGRLVFVLIGEVREIPAAVQLNSRHAAELRFEPQASHAAAIGQNAAGQRAIVINQLADPEIAWNGVCGLIQQELSGDLSSFQTAFGTAFNKLCEEAKLELVLPEADNAGSGSSFMSGIRAAVSAQCNQYCSVLQEAPGEAGGAESRNEAMRIAYNFADDALKVLQLLICVADLKAVLLWGTIKNHFEMAEAFRALPWAKSEKKPSLDQYRKMIGGARNRAFHNLLTFDRTIEADLVGVRINARRLTLLPAYSRNRSTIALDYEDREMVELLSELTRAEETPVPVEFWSKNATVMRAFEKLLERTESVLWTLNQIRGEVVA
ncbi:MAG: hypothetical protein GXY76_12010 [Chloroflexi bacterium]|nr:hypothetical protein [Chloroflexota bacterium]